MNGNTYDEPINIHEPEMTGIKTFCSECSKELWNNFSTLLHTDGKFYNYCNECASKKLNIVY